MAVKYLDDGNVDGTVLGQDATELIGFWGKAPSAQRAGASQGTFTTTMTQSTGWGFATSTAADAAVALLTEIRAALVACGLIKGSA